MNEQAYSVHTVKKRHSVSDFLTLMVMAEERKETVNERNVSKLLPYHCPEWAKSLSGIPKYRIQLSNTITPIHEWNLPNIPEGYSVSIKRDDMTGSTLSGNKVRKLEFQLAAALQKNCRHVITAGSLQSNHCRITALAARQLGLIPHLILFSDIQNTEEIGAEGNLLLDRLACEDFYLVSDDVPFYKLHSRIEALARTIKDATNEDVYCTPVGGCDRLGVFGYINAFEELLSQNLHDDFDDMVIPLGTGGTAMGLGIANFLTGSKMRMHIVPVSLLTSKEYYFELGNTLLREMNIADKIRAEDLFDIIEDYVGDGYQRPTEQEMNFIIDISQRTGIVLDSVYTGKAALALTKELTKNPQRFKGKRILFLHTGGIFQTFDGKMDSIIKQRSDHCFKLLDQTCDVAVKPSE